MINSINSTAQSVETKSSTVVPFKSPPPGENSKVYDLKDVEKQKTDEVQEKKTENPQEKVEHEREEKISEEMLNELSHDIEMLHSIGLKFSQHEESGRTMVSVMDKDSKEIIRQIPAEDILDMAVKLEEMVGILFDEKV